MGQPLESRLVGLLCCSNFYKTPGEMGGGALGGSLQRARRYEAPIKPFLAARCGRLMLESLQAASCPWLPASSLRLLRQPRGALRTRTIGFKLQEPPRQPLSSNSAREALCGIHHHTPATARTTAQSQLGREGLVQPTIGQ